MKSFLLLFFLGVTFLQANPTPIARISNTSTLILRVSCASDVGNGWCQGIKIADNNWTIWWWNSSGGPWIHKHLTNAQAAQDLNGSYVSTFYR